MFNIKFFLKLVFFIGVVLVTTAFAGKVSAETTVITRQASHLDERLVKDDARFSTATQVLLVPIQRPDHLTENDSEWFRGLYYFYTARLGFPDIPFHYIVGSGGDVFEGNKGGDEQLIPIEGVEGSAIIIGYMADQGETNFSLESFSSLEAIVLETANRNAIKPENWKLSNIEVVVDLENKEVKLRNKDIFGSWSEGMKEIVNEIKGSYSPVNKVYEVELVSALSPAGKVDPGDSTLATIKVKNTGKYTIYQGTGAELLALTKNGNDSIFFVNGIWASPKQPTLMEEGTFIRPGEEKEFRFRLSVPLFFGQQNEQFILTTVNGNQFTNAEFTVSMDINSISQKVVEILPTDTGFLNVRDAASGSANVFTKVNPGQRYILVKDEGNGWYNIDLGNNQNGWISKQFAKIVN